MRKVFSLRVTRYASRFTHPPDNSLNIPKKT